jgi:hypothetical protein
LDFLPDHLIKTFGLGAFHFSWYPLAGLEKRPDSSIKSTGRFFLLYNPLKHTLDLLGGYDNVGNDGCENFPHFNTITE